MSWKPLPSQQTENSFLCCIQVSMAEKPTHSHPYLCITPKAMTFKQAINTDQKKLTNDWVFLASGLVLGDY